jgi:hypothetical protein
MEVVSANNKQEYILAYTVERKAQLGFNSLLASFFFNLEE